MSSQFWWFVARSSGLVAGALLALTLIWGLLLATGLIDRRGLPAWLSDLHRALGGLTGLFVGLHLVALVADTYVHLSWGDLLVPFASAYHRGPLAWGVLALWMLAAVEATSLARRRLDRSTWWRIHLLAYPGFLLTGLHAAGTGTDRGNPVFVVTALALVGVVVFLTTVRILSPRRVRPRSGRIPTEPPSELATTAASSRE